MDDASWDDLSLEANVRGLCRRHRRQKKTAAATKKTAAATKTKKTKTATSTGKSIVRVKQTLTKKTTTTKKKLTTTTDTESNVITTDHPGQVPPNAVRIGGDCSGLETLVVAARLIGLPVDHVFSSEVDPATRSILLENHAPRLCYKDVTKRNHAEAPAVTIYGAGAPCQPFSTQGLREGALDLKGRGLIIAEVLAYVSAKLPDAVILENVAGLASKKHRQLFDGILQWPAPQLKLKTVESCATQLGIAMTNFA